jgi:hypothetical protein
MWSNGNPSSSKNRARAASYRKVANIKGYLGGLNGFSSVIEEERNDNEDASYGDMSSLGCVSTTLESTTTTTTSSSETAAAATATTTRNHHHHHQQQQPSVLVEIPENFPQQVDHVDSTSSDTTPTNEVDEFYSCIDNNTNNDDEDLSVTQQKIGEMKRRWEKQQQKQRRSAKNNKNSNDDRSAIQEIENSLSDIDTYLLSVYMNDDASIYTKATDSSFSSSGSVSSTHSTRRRHRGAYHNRRGIALSSSSSSSSSSSRNDGGEKKNTGGTWLETMRESSQNFFVDNQGGWTASRGWQMQPAKKTWGNQPNNTSANGWWNDVDHIFDAVKEERLEI